MLALQKRNKSNRDLTQWTLLSSEPLLASAGHSLRDMQPTVTALVSLAAGLICLTNCAKSILTRQPPLRVGLFRGASYHRHQHHWLDFCHRCALSHLRAARPRPPRRHRPGLVNTAMAKGEGLFWVMPVEKVANQIVAAIRKQKSKAYVTKRWHFLAIINKNLPFHLYRLL